MSWMWPSRSLVGATWPAPACRCAWPSSPPVSTACSIGGVGPVELDERQGERAVERLALERVVDPGPGGDLAGVADLDHLGELLGGDRVVLERRHEHPPVGRLDADDEPLAQRGEERADDRARRAAERVLDDELRGEQLAVSHSLISPSFVR